MDQITLPPPASWQVEQNKLAEQRPIIPVDDVSASGTILGRPVVIHGDFSVATVRTMHSIEGHDKDAIVGGLPGLSREELDRPAEADVIGAVPKP